MTERAGTPPVEPLGKHHDRAAFSCGVGELDDYLRRRAGQDQRRKISQVFVAVDGPAQRVVGFYTLSALSIDAGALPGEIARRLPKYSEIPAALLGRLAVDGEFQGRGLGEHLLMDALARVCGVAEEIAIFALIVDAKDEAAAAFYAAYDFARLPNSPHRLFLPTARIRALLIE